MIVKTKKLQNDSGKEGSWIDQERWRSNDVNLEILLFEIEKPWRNLEDIWTSDY